MPSQANVEVKELIPCRIATVSTSLNAPTRWQALLQPAEWPLTHAEGTGPQHIALDAQIRYFQTQSGPRSSEKLPETQDGTGDSAPAFPRKRSINWACLEWTWGKNGCVRGGGGGGGGIQLFSIIKNATSKVELPQLFTTVWCTKSGLEPWGILARMTFINLITEILIWGSQRRRECDSAQWWLHSSEGMGFMKVLIDAGRKLRENVAHIFSPLGSHGDTLSGDWSRAILVKTDARRPSAGFY